VELVDCRYSSYFDLLFAVLFSAKELSFEHGRPGVSVRMATFKDEKDIIQGKVVPFMLRYSCGSATIVFYENSVGPPRPDLSFLFELAAPESPSSFFVVVPSALVFTEALPAA